MRVATRTQQRLDCTPVNRAHARQDKVTINSAGVKATMEEAGISTARWDDAKRKECEKVFTLIRKNKMASEHREALRELIRERLVEASEAKVDNTTAP
jgi:hypothetical protein